MSFVLTPTSCVCIDLATVLPLSGSNSDALRPDALREVFGEKLYLLSYVSHTFFDHSLELSSFNAVAQSVPFLRSVTYLLTSVSDAAFSMFLHWHFCTALAPSHVHIAPSQNFDPSLGVSPCAWSAAFVLSSAFFFNSIMPRATDLFVMCCRPMGLSVSNCGPMRGT